MKAAFIPIHDFYRNTTESVPFRYIPLGQRSDYDTTEAHRHNYYEIFLFAQGGGWHEIDFQTHEIADQSIHFVSPGQVHQVSRALDSFGSILLFSSDFYHFGTKAGLFLFEYPFFNTYPHGSPIINLNKNQFDELHSLSQAMNSEKSNSALPDAEVIRSYLHIFLRKCRQFSEVAVKPIKEETQLFSKLKQLLEINYTEQHYPAYYAEKLALSQKKLNDVCRLSCGLTMSSLIHDRLLLEAKRLLLHSDHSIKEISYFLGFEDPAYFNRFFRKRNQMSAGQFRKSKTN